jgi:hypothetical protein
MQVLSLAAVNASFPEETAKPCPESCRDKEGGPGHVGKYRNIYRDSFRVNKDLAIFAPR